MKQITFRPEILPMYGIWGLLFSGWLFFGHPTWLLIGFSVFWLLLPNVLRQSLSWNKKTPSFCCGKQPTPTIDISLFGVVTCWFLVQQSLMVLLHIQTNWQYNLTLSPGWLLAIFIGLGLATFSLNKTTGQLHRLKNYFTRDDATSVASILINQSGKLTVAIGLTSLLLLNAKVIFGLLSSTTFTKTLPYTPMLWLVLIGCVVIALNKPIQTVLGFRKNFYASLSLLTLLALAAMLLLTLAAPTKHHSISPLHHHAIYSKLFVVLCNSAWMVILGFYMASKSLTQAAGKQALFILAWLSLLYAISHYIQALIQPHANIVLLACSGILIWLLGKNRSFYQSLIYGAMAPHHKIHQHRSLSGWLGKLCVFLALGLLMFMQGHCYGLAILLLVSVTWLWIHVVFWSIGGWK